MSNSQIDHRQWQIATTYDLLQRNPQMRAHAIARHYLSLTATAEHLFHLTDRLRLPEMTDKDRENLDSATKHLLDQIADQHAYDLGIELKWPKTVLITGNAVWNQLQPLKPNDQTQP